MSDRADARDVLQEALDTAVLIGASRLADPRPQCQLVTAKAVQRHLRNVHRELGIDSHEELYVALGLGA